MKYILILVFAFLGLGCAGGGGADVVGPTFVQPTNPQQAYDQLIGKNFYGPGLYFKFKADGTLDAKFTGLSSETHLGANVQKTFDCHVTATSFFVSSVNSPTQGTFFIKLVGANQVKSGVSPSAAPAWDCYSLSLEIKLKRESLNYMSLSLNGYDPAASPPPAQQFYEGDGTETYLSESAAF